ncbi:MAG: hypothetical protein AB1546_00265 [bacterium]
MLAENLRAIDINPDHIERLMSDLFPDPPAKPEGIIIFYEGNQLLHAVHSRRGPMKKINFLGPQSTEEIARTEKAEFVICIEKNTLPKIATNFQSHIHWDDPYLFQLIPIIRAVRGEIGSNIHIYPDITRKIPRIPDKLLKLLPRILPRRAIFSIVIFDADGTVWTSLIIGTTGAEISLITTTEALEPLAADPIPFSRKIIRINRAIAKILQPPTASIFMDREIFRHLCAHPRPISELLKLHSKGWLRIQPFPIRLRILLMLMSFLKI